MPAWNYRNVGSSIVDTLAQIAAEREQRQRQAEAAAVAAQTRDRDYGLKTRDLDLRERSQHTNEQLREDAAAESKQVHNEVEKGRQATRGLNLAKTVVPGVEATDAGLADMSEAGVVIPTREQKAPRIDVGGAGYLMLGMQPAAMEKDKRVFSAGGSDWQMARERADETKALSSAQAQARADADKASDERDSRLRTELQKSSDATRLEVAGMNNATRQTVADTAAQAKADAAAEKKTAADKEATGKRGAITSNAQATLNLLDSIHKPKDENGNAPYDHPGLGYVTGGAGVEGLVRRVSPFVSQDAVNANALIEQLKSKLVVDLIGEMKAQSRTGATGFGQLSEREGQILMNAAAGLDTTQSTEQFTQHLDIIREKLNKMLQEPAIEPVAAHTQGGSAAPSADDLINKYLQR